MTDSEVNLVDDSVSSITSGLLRRVQGRDQLAWEQLLRVYTPLVFRWARLRRLQPVDAENIVQDVFMSAAGAIVDFERKHEGQSFRAWLRRITENKIRDHWRLQKERPIAEGGSDALAAWGHLAHESNNEQPLMVASEETLRVFAEMIECVRNDFEESTWRAFLSVVVDGRPPADVADELNMSINAVYVAKSRVLQRLRDNFT